MASIRVPSHQYRREDQVRARARYIVIEIPPVCRGISDFTKKEKRACKPGSVYFLSEERQPFICAAYPRDSKRTTSSPKGGLSLLGLAPGGVYLPRMLPWRAVGSYSTFSHLTPCDCTGRSILCGTCRFRYEPEPLFNTRRPVLWCPDFPLRITERLPGPFLYFINAVCRKSTYFGIFVDALHGR